jgi:hypothetical protein
LLTGGLITDGKTYPLKEKLPLSHLIQLFKADERSFWGYRINKKDYRFYNNQTYEVVAQDSLIILRKDIQVESTATL